MAFKIFPSNPSTHYVALVTSFITAAAVSVLITTILYGLGVAIHWYIVFFVFFISLPTSYLVSKYSIEIFINKKIRMIYRTMNAVSTEKAASLKEVNIETDPLEQVNKEVADWAQVKSDEIAGLKQQEKFRRDFIGNLAHELKTPIFNVQGYLHTLIEGGLEDEQINETYLNKADKNVDRMIGLIEDLDQISKLEAGEESLQVERFNLSETVYEIVDDTKKVAKKAGVKLSIGWLESRRIVVMGDEPKIAQVITNLVNNSIRYCKDDGLTEIKIEELENTYLLKVKDNGLGISDNDIPRIFERFYRVEKSRGRDVGGSGLGLAICKHIIESHNQRINVQSELGKGSTFSFTIAKG